MYMYLNLPTHTAVCYDHFNHCVWTSNDDWIDMWDCTGKVRLAVHHLATRLGKTSASELIPEPDKSQKTVEGIHSCIVVQCMLTQKPAVIQKIIHIPLHFPIYLSPFPSPFLCPSPPSPSPCPLLSHLPHPSPFLSTSLSLSLSLLLVSEAIRLLLRHIGIESCRLVPSSEMRSVVPHHLSLVFLDQCCDLLSAAMSEGDWENCQAISVTLLVSVRRGRGECEEGERGV